MKNLKEVIESDSFKNKLKAAIMEGIYEDWAYDGKDEYPVTEFDEDMATNEVLDLLKSELLQNR